MKDSKKQQVSLIMGKLLGKKDAEPSDTKDGVEQNDSIGMETAAEELLRAIEGKSSKGVIHAIKSMMDMAHSYDKPEAAHEASESESKSE